MMIVLRNILTVTLFAAWLPTLAQLPSEKRGLAYGHHSTNDLEVLSTGLTWWYNWAVTPESGVAESYTEYGFEFVPMAWNGNFNETALRDYLDAHPEVKYILGFNEPNFIDQANMTPSEAAAGWSKIEAIADDYNLKIVGPAVNYCGNCVSEGGTTYTDPFDYLDDFFTACTGCRVDHIAVHSYMNTVAALDWYIGEFKKYGKPIWLTEFAGWEQNGTINNAEDQINYLIGAVDLLEYDTAVFRYSWFIGRGSGADTYPYIDILDEDGTLTPLGEVYINMPVHDPELYYSLPGRIEAEAYTHMSGILLEKTSDVDGFANVGYIEAGDWLEYNVEIAGADEYFLLFRTSANSNASFEIYLDGEFLLAKDIASTGGWQEWTSVSTPVELPTGKHTLRLEATTAGFNINWLAVTTEQPAASYVVESNRSISIYPVPTSGELQIESFEPIHYLEIVDLNGKVLLASPFSPTIDTRSLNNGFYFLKAYDEHKRMVQMLRFLKIHEN